jgi:hypothetical protein
MGDGWSPRRTNDDQPIEWHPAREKNPPQVVVDVHGVGYELDVPMSTFYNLPENGEKLSLLTHFAVREDGQFLYGFASESERFAFRQLLKISGVGARMALSVLSGLSVGDLAQVVCPSGSRAADQGAGNRHQDRRTPAARTQGQARRRAADGHAGGRRQPQ